MVYSRRCVFQIFRYGVILSQVIGLEILYDHDILYPLSLLWIHTFITFLTTLLTQLTVKSLRGNAHPSPRAALVLSTTQLRWERVLRIAAGLLDVVTQLCVVQALFQSRSITLPMLFYYVADIVVQILQLAYLRFRPNSVRSAAALLLTPILLVIPFIILIILAERKLNPLALLFLFIGAGSHIAKALINFYQGYSFGQRTTERNSQWPPWLTLTLVLVTTSTFITFGLEGLILSSRGGLEKLRVDLHPVFLVPSILLGIMNALDYSGHDCKNGSVPEDFKSADSQADYVTSRATLDAVAMFICTLLLFLQTPTWIQLISYGSIAAASTLAVFVLCKTMDQNIELLRTEISEPDHLELEDYSATRKLLDNEEIGIRRKRSCLRGSFYSFTLKLWILFAGLLGTKLLLERPSHNTRIDQITSNRLSDASFQNATSMDIVISYFKEDLDGVTSFLEQVKAIPRIQQLQPNIIIYTKNNNSNISDIKARTGANEVTILPNEGREGGTYLRHIIDRWENLANHTLFIQAEPHARKRVIDRLKLYFDPARTGMLDLGYRELRGCKCLDCRDEYSWRDVTGFIPDLMAQAHHIKCDENTQVATSYKGQFVVSSKRIRAAKKSLYESLNDKLVGENRVIVGDEEEDPIDAPIFGYSLERSWSILFQCADLTGLRDMCPGLTLMGTPFGDLDKAQPEDCGCLD